MRAPTNPVSINCVGTGVLDRTITQQNPRTVREAGPYVHRDGLCEIKELYKPEIVKQSVNMNKHNVTGKACIKEVLK